MPEIEEVGVREIDFDDEGCPARRALDLVSDKWTPRVVLALENGTLRYNALRRELPGISQRMLTRSLRRLEAEKLVDRTVIDSIPPMVEYALTGNGKTMIPPIMEIADWGARHLNSAD